MPKLNINFRTLSLEGIKELKSVYSYPLYEQVLSRIFSGHENAILKKRFFSDIIPKHDNELEYQKSLLECLIKNIAQYDSQIQIKSNIVDEKKLAKEQAYKAYLNAEKEYKEALAELENGIRKKNSLEKTLTTADRHMKEINTVVLVHKTANINLLMKYNFGQIVMTKTDAKYMEGVFTPDIIFDNNLADGLMLTKNQNKLNLISESNRQSIVEYIQMIIYYFIESQKNFVLLYADKDISDFLKYEGIED